VNITKKCNPKKLDINPAKEGAREKNNKSVLTPLALIGLFAAPAGAVPMGQSDHALLNPITGGGIPRSIVALADRKRIRSL
jgi:hypothetical protein